MELDLKRKRELIEQKKREVPSHILQIGLNMLYIEPHDMTSRLANIDRLNLINLDKIFDTKDDNVFIDISLEPYNEKLDNIGFAKQLKPELGVVVKDIILEEYQIFLNRIYQVDAIAFPVSVLNRKAIEKAMVITSSMGILPIPMIGGEADLEKLPKDLVKALICNNSVSSLENILIFKFDNGGNLVKC